MCCRCCGVTQQKVWVFGIGTLMGISGLLSVIWGPSFMDTLIMKQLPLTPTSKTFEKWEELPIPVYLHMYLWNWTNAQEVQANGVKPIFEQLGPYVYREERKKMDLEWHDNGTVTFNPRRIWYWEEEMSGGKQTDIITGPHLPSIAAAHSMKDSNIFLKVMFNQALNANGGALYTTHTALEWLFEGFYDEFLHYAMNLNNPLAPEILDDHFAWFLHRNESKDFEGPFTVHTGVGDIKEMGEIKYWKGMNHTGWYEGECGRLNGSTTDLFVPDEPKEKALTIYIPDTCRIINLEYSGVSYEIEGIQGWKYEVTPNTFDNGQLNGNMKCYCPADRYPDDCPASGATSLAPCGDGAPMYLSADHFMYADESYANTITGFDPEYEKNNFYIIMERKMGVPLKVVANVMITLYMEQDSVIDILKGIPSFYAPLFTTSSQAQIDKALASELKLVLSLPSIARYMGVGLLCVGCILIAIGSLLTWKRKWYGQAEADRLALRDNEVIESETEVVPKNE
ncbi:protein croquemort [Drosophila pseudoobscura]|uniref:Protein croquemort n=1 Tax=Drosophila pseudoobscura pseudoobscura TaxID=46245 RepID=A0A6I8UKP7_DROPS|nr:protein croquemort [Drosophila pseudoobscura]